MIRCMLKKWEATDLAYLAGLIDGEGCFSIYRTARGKSVAVNPAAKGYYWKIVLRITNTEKTLMDWLVVHFGGSIGTHFNPSQRIRPLHQWKALSNLLRDLLPQALPFLVIKKRHAEITIESLRLLKLRTGGCYSHIGSPSRPFEQELVSLRNELVSINSFRHKTGRYSELDNSIPTPVAEHGQQETHTAALPAST